MIHLALVIAAAAAVTLPSVPPVSPIQVPGRAPAHQLWARLRRRDLERFRRPRIDPQASAAHPRHFPGQKLRLGGDALGADPTYLLYLAYRSRGELRRIDFAAWPRTHDVGA